MFTASDIFEALREVVDPELGINIVDLGLVYGLQIDGARVRLAITMTTPACRALRAWTSTSSGIRPGTPTG